MTADPQYAWLSTAAIFPDIMKAIRCADDFSEDPDRKARALAASSASHKGDPIPPGDVPTTFFAWRDKIDSAKKQTAKLPHLTTSGFWFVREKAAEVLGDFDLGQSKLHPIEMLMEDRVTPLPGGPYFLLDFNSHKDVFLPAHSPDMPLVRGSTSRYSARMTTKDDAAALSPEALDGADIWWNPNVWFTFFLSDPLAQALQKAGVDRSFALRRCRIVDPAVTPAPSARTSAPPAAAPAPAPSGGGLLSRLFGRR